MLCLRLLVYVSVFPVRCFYGGFRAVVLFSCRLGLYVTASGWSILPEINEIEYGCYGPCIYLNPKTNYEGLRGDL